MRRAAKRWLDGLRALGEAYLGVIKAELGALEKDLGASGRRLVVSLGVIALSLGIGFWALAALTFAAIEILAIWLPRWGASLIVALFLLILAAVVGSLGWRRLRGIESPKATVERHLEDHRDWWREQIGTPGGRPQRGPDLVGGEDEE
ncbi:MAG TPA: phage holin family protein [Thermoanaerobaculia bacterium]|nr:phage holin family protein [Thermoanaerobaculia bacterium]